MLIDSPIFKSSTEILQNTLHDYRYIYIYIDILQDLADIMSIKWQMMPALLK